MRQMPKVFRHSTSDALKMAMIPMDCAERLSNGTSQDGDWDTLASRLNIGCILARWHFPDASELVGESLDIIAGNTTLDSPQHDRIVEALHLINQMEAQVTRRELSKVIEFVFKSAGKKRK